MNCGRCRVGTTLAFQAGAIWHRRFESCRPLHFLKGEIVKYPCKLCLVQAACSKECDEYKKFIKFIQDVWVPLTTMFMGTILVFSLLLTVIFYDDDTLRTTILITWITSFIIIAIIDWGSIWESPFFMIFFAPMMAGCMIIWKIMATMYKRV